jgi:hypothetical protein
MSSLKYKSPTSGVWETLGGFEGPTGPTGPASIGPTGPTGPGGAGGPAVRISFNATAGVHVLAHYTGNPYVVVAVYNAAGEQVQGQVTAFSPTTCTWTTNVNVGPCVATIVG